MSNPPLVSHPPREREAPLPRGAHCAGCRDYRPRCRVRRPRRSCHTRSGKGWDPGELEWSLHVLRDIQAGTPLRAWGGARTRSAGSPPHSIGRPTPRVCLPSHRPAMAALREKHRRPLRRRRAHVRRIRNRPSVGQGDRYPPPFRGGVLDPSARVSPRRIGIQGGRSLSSTRFRTVAISAQVSFTSFSRVRRLFYHEVLG